MSISIQLVTKYNPSKAYHGYTLFGPMGSNTVYLVDMEGRFVHCWETPHNLSLHGKLLKNGNLLVGQRIPDGPIIDMPGSGGELIEIDWDGKIVWKYEDLYINSHDWDRMENGNTLIAHWMPMPKEIADRVKGGIPGSEREGVMWGDSFQEITPDGKIIWEWAAFEHMDFKTDILCPLCDREGCIYVNSLVALPDGNILTLFRLINTVAIIDKTTGNLKWKWGDEELGHPHNPTLLDNGNILVFDNSFHRKMHGLALPYYSRVLEVNPNTKKIEWEYKDKYPFNFYSPIISGTQRLPNGNTLICEGTKGRIFEVTREKETVWEFVSPFYYPYRGSDAFGINNFVFRAYRYGPDYEGLKGRKLDPERFEWGLQEKGKAPGEIHRTSEEDVIKHRLKRLGY
jgi:Arylsulfotransferase (ASST)